VIRSWREVAAGYDEAAAGYDERHGDRRGAARARVLDAPLLDAARGARRVLELGAGTGRLLAQLDAPVAIGVDVSPGMLARARARGLRVVRGDAQRLPFATAAFDAVVAGKGVFRYLDPDRGFAEAARVLRPGGVLALHQYGARTWSPRHGRRAPAAAVHEVDRVDDLLARAGRHGLTPTLVRRWRSVRIRPYLLEIPAWLDRAAPVQLWGHLVVVLRRE